MPRSNSVSNHQPSYLYPTSLFVVIFSAVFPSSSTPCLYPPPPPLLLLARRKVLQPTLTSIGRDGLPSAVIGRFRLFTTIPDTRWPARDDPCDFSVWQPRWNFTLSALGSYSDFSNSWRLGTNRHLRWWGGSCFSMRCCCSKEVQ